MHVRKPGHFLRKGHLKQRNDIHLISKSKFATVVEGDPKAPFSIATTPMCKEACYFFPWGVSSGSNCLSDGLWNRSKRVRTPVTLLRSLSHKYPWERYEPPYPPSYGPNSTTTVLLGELVWH